MIVVKIGGAAGTDRSSLVREMRDLKDVILVHGGSDEMNRISCSLGNPPRTLTSPSGHVSRYTDKETLDMLKMAYSGLVNKTLVEDLRSEGVNAMGLTGLDGGLLRGRRKKAIRSVENGKVKIIRDDRSGRVEEVNTDLLHTVVGEGYVPVITIPIESESGRAINADADRAAAAIAGAVGARDLVLLTDQPGLLRDPEDPYTLVSSISVDGMEEAMRIAKGRMKKKVLAAREALEGGVKRAIISRANKKDPIRNAMSGKGTVIS